ncbi:MAG TPA: VTT domain-containing protein [Candidatus Polarisedimenticolia bacterium]|jgi:membrane protein DedA with SNARE-associated domain|nr:VTT domain-containing protein [Candidatus Polarisedimenticolia bacterium]
MSETLEFVVRHGYVVLFAWMVAEQLGLPIPAIPFLLAAGALAGSGRLSLTMVLLVSVVASLLADTLWYEIGRRKGVRVLNFLCRVSLEPDSCVRQTEQIFGRYGVRSLLVSKFVPGLSTAAPPLAGIFGMRLPRFLWFAGLGALLYAAAFAGLGYLFSSQLERMAAGALVLGEWLVLLLLGALALFVLGKVWQRRRFLHNLRVARITPEELKERLDRGEPIVVVDLRHALDLDAEPHHIPGALHLTPDDIENRHEEIPRDRDVVLYCT